MINNVISQTSAQMGKASTCRLQNTMYCSDKLEWGVANNHSRQLIAQNLFTQIFSSKKTGYRGGYEQQASKCLQSDTRMC